MSDARWFDVDSDVNDAIEHFAKACEIFETSGFDGATLAGYIESMALMHSVQSGYTSLEGALLRILDILGEHRPTGEKWHQDLTRRSARDLAGEMSRPAILPASVFEDVEEVRRFRHRAARNYNSFEASKAHESLAACRRLVATLPDAVRRFRVQVEGASSD